MGLEPLRYVVVEKRLVNIPNKPQAAPNWPWSILSGAIDIAKNRSATRTLYNGFGYFECLNARYFCQIPTHFMNLSRSRALKTLGGIDF